MPQRVTYCLIAVGWTAMLAFALAAAWSGGSMTRPRTFQLAYLVGFAGYFLLLGGLLRANAVHIPGRWTLWLGGCLLVRVILLPTEPSDDTARYIWEGRVQRAGFDPYRLPPDDPRLQPLREGTWPRINHPHFPAIYPPFAQLEFYLAALIHPSPHTVKLLHAVWDALTVLILGATLRRRGLAPHWAVAYALCPIVLAAFAVEGHLDSLMILCVAGSVWATTANKLYLAGALIGLAVSAKTVSVVLLPWLVWRHWRAAVIAAAAILLCYLPYGMSGFAGLENLVRFAGGGAFLAPTALLPASWRDTRFARAAAAVLFAATLLVLCRRRRQFEHYAASAFGALILLLPILHFWYLTWVFSLQGFHLTARWPAAGVAMVVYFEAQRFQATEGTWRLPDWAPALVWGVFAAAWLADSAWARYRRLSQS